MADSPAVLATICARQGSRGIPGKNVKVLNGKPLIVIAIECARAAQSVGHIVISTDGEDIARIAEEAGVPVRYRRPPELASDAAAKVDAIRHVTEFVEREEHFHPSIVVDLDIGVPLRIAADVDACVAKIASDASLDAVVTVYEAERNPYFNMVEVAGAYVKLVKRPERTLVRRQDAPTVYSVTPSVFAFRREALSRIRHLNDGTWGAVTVPRERSIDIDEPLDLEFVTFLASRGGRR